MTKNYGTMEPIIERGLYMDLVIRENVLICTMTGHELTFAEVANVSFVLSKAIDEHPGKDLIINVASLTNMDSSGVGLLINFTMKLQKNGNMVYVVNPPAKLMRIISMLKMGDVINVVHSMEQALSSYL